MRFCKRNVQGKEKKINENTKSIEIVFFFCQAINFDTFAFFENTYFRFNTLKTFIAFLEANFLLEQFPIKAFTNSFINYTHLPTKPYQTYLNLPISYRYIHCMYTIVSLFDLYTLYIYTCVDIVI